VIYMACTTCAGSAGANRGPARKPTGGDPAGHGLVSAPGELPGVLADRVSRSFWFPSIVLIGQVVEERIPQSRQSRLMPKNADPVLILARSSGYWRRFHSS